MTVDIAGSTGNDLDQYIFRDLGPPGLDPGDPIVCSSTSPNPVESCPLGSPPDGNYIIAVHGWSVPGGSTTFTMVIQISAVAAGSACSLVNAPSTDIAPNTAVQPGIGCTIRPTKPPG